MKQIKRNVLAVAVVAALGLSACVDDGENNVLLDNGTQQAKSDYVTSGVITAFGSVFINGVKYETDDASFNIDDQAGTENQLKLGMYITLSGSVNADGTTGTAATIEFENDVEGLVLANNIATDGTLNVMGQVIIIDENTKFESNVDGQLLPSDIAVNNLVEVSGYSSGNGSIHATRIEVKKATKEAGDEIELKGIVSLLGDTTFNIGETVVDYSSAQLEDFEGAVLANGMFVEVKSEEGFDQNQRLIVNKIELENEDGKTETREEDEEMEFEGVVTLIPNETQTLVEINGQAVVLNSDTELENGNIDNLLSGAKVEVEGVFDANGNFIAQEIEFRSEAIAELEARIESVNVADNTVVVMGKTFVINTHTVMDDEYDVDGVEPVRYFSLSDVAVNDWVEIKYYTDENGQLIATKFRRDEVEVDEESGVALYELEGEVESIGADGTVVISGFSVDVSALQGFNYTVGDQLEVEGSYAAGVFTVLEVEIDD